MSESGGASVHAVFVCDIGMDFEKVKKFGLSFPEEGGAGGAGNCQRGTARPESRYGKQHQRNRVKNSLSLKVFPRRILRKANRPKKLKELIRVAFDCEPVVSGR